MTRVRYVNKKTGWVSIYESESHYDPITKSSRPKRTYIGYEDPITKEFVPSSGRRGRRKRENKDQDTQPENIINKCVRLQDELDKQLKENKHLLEQVEVLTKKLGTVCNAVATLANTVSSIQN